MKKISIIMMKQDKLLELAKDVGRSRRAVYMALKGVTDGEMPELIRHKALAEYGGMKTTKTIMN